MRARKPRGAALLVALVLGGILRFWGIGLGTPFHFHPDEHLVMRGAARLGTSVRAATEIKYYFTYGTFPRALLGAVAGAVQSFRDFRSDDAESIRLFYLIARSISAAAGTATILLVYVIGRSLWDRRAGAQAAGRRSLSVLHMRDCHFYTVDPLWVLTLTLFLLLCWRFVERRGLRWLLAAAIVAGAALATKLSSVLCFGPAVLAILWRAQTESPRWRAAVRHTAVFGTVAGVAFFVFNFPVLVNPQAFLDIVKTLLGWATGGGAIRQADLQFVGTRPYLYWLTNLLPWGMGPLLTVASVAAVVVHLRRWRRPGLLVCALLIPYFAVQASSFQKFIRFTLPLYPGLCLLTAAWLATGMPRRWKRIVAGVVLAGTALYCIAYHSIFRTQDVRIEAARWLNAHLTPGDVVVVEPAHVNPPFGSMLTQPDFWRSYVPPPDPYYQEERGDIVVRYLDTYRQLYAGALSPVQQRAYLDSVLSGADWVVVTPRYRDQYLRLPKRYPVLAEYYRDLLAGRLGFAVERIFQRRPRLLGLVLDDASSELTFRLFDHPTIWVLRRDHR